YLVTGASRGLGAEFVQQLLRRGHTVIAAVREPDSASSAARAGAKVVRLDVTRPETFEAFARALDGPIDALINNAGVAATDASLPSMTGESWEQVFQTNVFGQALLVRALLPLLRRGKRKTIANVSSSLGSLAVTTGGFSYAYCCSKSALNILTGLTHQELAGHGLPGGAVGPGRDAPRHGRQEGTPRAP